MKESTKDAKMHTLIPVRFMAYESHSAFVIISRGESRKRCSRDNLFIMVKGGNK